MATLIVQNGADRRHVEVAARALIGRAPDCHAAAGGQLTNGELPRLDMDLGHGLDLKITRGRTVAAVVLADTGHC